MSSVFVGDVGTVITIDCGINIQNAAVMQIKVKRPDLSTTVWPAVLAGATSLKHALLAGELNMKGTWQLQPYVELPTWRGRGSWVELKVEL